MPEEAAKNLRVTEELIACQIARVRSSEAAGRFDEARLAREILGVITETRDALRLRLAVARKVKATAAKARGEESE